MQYMTYGLATSGSLRTILRFRSAIFSVQRFGGWNVHCDFASRGSIIKFCVVQLSIANRDGPKVRLWHSAEAAGLSRLTERVPNVWLNVVC